MKMTTLGIALSLLVGCAALEARGNFRRIYQEDGEKARENTIHYLQTKMVGTHKLNNMTGEEDRLQWDLYLFKKFVKKSFSIPFVGAESHTPDAHYASFKQSTLFMLRSAHSSFEFMENISIIININQFITPLKNIKNIITPEAIENWVNDSRNPETSQELKGKEFLAKSHIIQAWREWTRTKGQEEGL